MTFQRRRIQGVLATAISIVGLVVGLVGPAQAVIVGLPANAFDGNCMPFGCDLGVTRYQQVYPGTAFPGAITISQLTFFQFADSRLPPGDLLNGTLTFSLSTTSKQVGGLDAIDMNNNVGANSALFTIETLSGTPAGSSLSFVGAPFFYDPALGNLLLDIEFSGVFQTGVTAFFKAPASEGVTGRCASIGGTACFEDLLGLVTEFGPSEAPEPATLMLLAIGAAGLGVSRRRTSAKRSRHDETRFK